MTSTRMSHKEMTSHIRGRLRHAGIKAGCRLYTACGVRYISISTPEYGKYFSAEQLREIGIIAQVNGLTEARRTPIDIENIVAMTRKDQFDFEFHG